ncbi:uncharacterized protein PAC_13365 [Phialocephala subalpina]|uniref:BZIP domain-containing protein n=1 Tax=Phialocephala subalpina TaxID=576137 RepID=A0A1L7XEM5_9HELO|nr:uncharacterized protein PAC_13365 [Phialocephala subalpina]
MTSANSAKEKANLARIRDNQRRSRARRKEYLQELEARLRQCELQGIEASSEIQMAARRVADENKKLRGLLAQHGVDDDTVDSYLQTSPLDAPYTNSSGAVQLLEQLLQMRKTCCTDGNNPQIGGGGGSRDSSASVTTVQSLWDPIYTQQNTAKTGSLQQLGMGGKAAISAHQVMTPGTSSASRTSSVNHGHASSHSIPHHPRLTPTQMPRSPASNASHQSQHHMFDFDPQLSSSSSYLSHQSHAQKHLLPHSGPGTQRSSIYIYHILRILTSIIAIMRRT